MSYTSQSPVLLSTDEGRRIYDWVQRELEAITRAQNNPKNELYLRVLYVEPEKPRAGMVIYADGTTWDPGSGEGVYRYSLGDTWEFLG